MSRTTRVCVRISRLAKTHRSRGQSADLTMDRSSPCLRLADSITGTNGARRRVRDVFMHGPPKMALAQRNDPVEAFFLDGSHKPFGVGIRVRRAIRRLDDTNLGLLQHLPERGTPFRIPVTDQHATDLRIRHRQRAPPWRMNASSGCNVDPRIWTRRDSRWITKTV